MFRKRHTTPYYQEITAFIEKYYIKPSSVPESQIGSPKVRHFKEKDSEGGGSGWENLECESSGEENSERKDFEWDDAWREDSEDAVFECEDSGKKISQSAGTDASRSAFPRRAAEVEQPEYTFLCSGIMSASLQEALNQVDESFQEMLLRKIDESGMTDAQCYRKAHIDRRLFSKIRSNPQYQPSRQTVISFGIALELPLDEMKELLMKAGFALSHASKADLIVEFFIRRGNYNLYEINEALSAFGQTLLGA